ncbi:hypothetical protein VHA01S_005_00290 [Vibrio halioticoli NBRC 102217]|uniref:HTH cro/C1-type domain-containing protein n=1 Tax=Vibrio halioticoli NBRC 102217 TaxID=1219072 RepID=V5FHF1_9VIBR|nr:helix-turn-helix transcriptional regulator [Vibrio halioticoli]GAD88427.1 hypothetical protein VHA01S_005_00290 [Vibrio halioticoli NBRC 102217]
MNPKLFQLRKELQHISANMEEILSDIEDASNSPVPSYSIFDKKLLINDLRERRKGISYEDLELQTDISRSTLMRIMKDPANTSLENFLVVANELGMKIWIEK